MTTHPGPPPAEFEFPFAAARRLREAAEALAEATRTRAGHVDDLASQAAVGFAGRSRDAFDQAVVGLVDELHQAAGVLETQADELADLLGDARRARERHEDAMAGWRRALSAWQDAEG